MRSTHCLPWNQYHRESDLSYPLCTRDKTSKFELLMASMTVLNCSHCLPLCEGVEFASSVDTRLLDPALECGNIELQMSAFAGENTKASFLYWRKKGYWVDQFDKKRVR